MEVEDKFYFTFTGAQGVKKRVQGVKNLSGGKNNQILHENNQCFQYCIFRFRPRYNL